MRAHLTAFLGGVAGAVAGALVTRWLSRPALSPALPMLKPLQTGKEAAAPLSHYGPGELYVDPAAPEHLFAFEWEESRGVMYTWPNVPNGYFSRVRYGEGVRDWTRLQLLPNESGRTSGWPVVVAPLNHYGPGELYVDSAAPDQLFAFEWAGSLGVMYTWRNVPGGYSSRALFGNGVRDWTRLQRIPNESGRASGWPRWSVGP